MKQKKNTSFLTAIRTLSPYLKRHIGGLMFTLLMAIISVALTLLIPILVGRAIDAIVDEGNVDFARVGVMMLYIGIAIGITALAQWLMNISNNQIAYEIVEDLRRDALGSIQHLPLSYLDSHPTGDVVSRVIQDADTVADGLLMGFTQLFTGFLTILGTLGCLVWLNLPIAIAVVVLTPLSLFVAKFIATRTYHMFQLQSKTRGEQTAFIDEMIGGQKVVQAFSHGDEAEETFTELNERLRQHSLRATFFSSLVNPSTRVVNNLVYAVVALLGALMMIYPDAIVTLGAPLTVGTIATCLSYANQYTKPFNEISGVITELQNAAACAARITALIEEPKEISDEEGERLTEVTGDMTLTDVSFSYTPDRPLIQHLSLAVKAGMRVAIVGPTGCGKTTLINLLMRFYDVKEGSITLDGYDIRSLTRHSLRSNIGMVLQDTWVRGGTVRENIAMGAPHATDEEIVAAAKAAHAHGFIKRLPQGYDTYLAGDGGGLSQGEKQLLSIARVMLTKPELLILDEATSSIDTRTERKIQDAFHHLMEGRTSFIVAHRLSTIREADLILVMRDGNVIEQGTHETLLSQKGFYYTLYNSQFDTE